MIKRNLRAIGAGLSLVLLTGCATSRVAKGPLENPSFENSGEILNRLDIKISEEILPQARIELKRLQRELVEAYESGDKKRYAEKLREVTAYGDWLSAEERIYERLKKNY